MPSLAMTESIDTRPLEQLPFLGLIRVEGPDAESFLQGQLTNDVRLLADGRTQLAALNTPQGRVVALLRLRQHQGAIHALLPADLVDKVVMLLRRYVLRAKVRLEPAADRVVAWGPSVAPSDVAAPLPLTFQYAPGRVVGVAGRAADVAGAAASAADTDRSTHDWMAADVAAGLPQVFAATSEAFIPQMLNLDLLDGLSFSKGCYTGQEIVVRTQHLGRIKRRTLRYRVASGPPPAPLDGLFHDGLKVADVLMSVGVGDAVELLAVTQLETRHLPLALVDGRIAMPVDLPYTVPA
jgi:folate-binding protein YgfZ